MPEEASEAPPFLLTGTVLDLNTHWRWSSPELPCGA